MKTPNNEQKIEDGASDGPRTNAGEPTVVAASPRAVCSALNRVIIAGRDEIVALNTAAGIVGGAERLERLRKQAERRLVFQHDLMAAVTALGGVPAQNASRLARLMTAARGVRTFLSEPHAGDAYAVCARAAQNSVAACSKALTLGLPADVRFGVEQQCAEIESDCSELSRLRYGASVSPLPAARRMITPDGVDSPSYTAAEDERALEDWTEDGGAGEGGPTNARMPLTSPGGCAVPRSPA